jgi:hypothetical protein
MMKDAIRLGTAMMKDAIRLGTNVMKAVIASRRPGRPGRPGRPAVSGHAGAAPQARGYWGVGVCVSGHVRLWAALTPALSRRSDLLAKGVV